MKDFIFATGRFFSGTVDHHFDKLLLMGLIMYLFRVHGADDMTSKELIGALLILLTGAARKSQ